MPTKDDFLELKENCTSERTTVNGVTGYKYTGWNGNSIFLPDGKIKNGANETSAMATYWNSSSTPINKSQCQVADCFSPFGNIWTENRAYGLAVRPVSDAATGSNIDGYKVHRTDGTTDIYSFQEVAHIEAYLEKEYDPNAPTDGDYVDLGLPSGIKWASCNLGAVNPSDFGNYYTGYSAYMKEVSVQDGYSIPGSRDFEELIENCEVKTVTYNNVQGNMFTSKINGNKIFMPWAGFYYYGGEYWQHDGRYWSYSRSTASGWNNYRHYYLRLTSDSAVVDCQLEGSSYDRSYLDRYSLRLIHN